MTSKVLKKYKFKKIKQRWVSFGVLDYSAKIASHLTEPFSHSYIKSEAMAGCRNEFSILNVWALIYEIILVDKWNLFVLSASTTHLAGADNSSNDTN